ncbi:MAG: restriction endonuclease [Crocosphaera sp.]|nr:restriction endonuclease [Crocosphaera sp.]
MEIEVTDFNDSASLINKQFSYQWDVIETILTSMPLHLKASSQLGIEGSPIFDPVGTNEFIKTELVEQGWYTNIAIPKKYQFLGKDIDCGNSGMIIEFQFSNYPFLLNNLLRSELFFKSQITLNSDVTKLVIIITKAKMVPASNSTLYYEQAVKQLTALTQYKVFDVPIRLVGLFEKFEEITTIVWSQYKQQRSRKLIQQKQCQCIISPGKKHNSRAIITML